MNHNPTAYTSLEAFALFQELNRNFQNGLVIGTFSRISETLRNTPLIYEQDNYDADRLSPDSLQSFALQLLREERKEEKRREAEAAAADKNSATLSPNSRKRKLQSPPLPTFQDALEQKDKLPTLVEKLYARFRDSLVKEIREDERRFEELQRELTEIERGEWDNKLGVEQHPDSNKNGLPVITNSVPGGPEGQITPTPVQTPAPVSTPVPIPAPVPPKIHDPGRRVVSPQTSQPPQERKPVQSVPLHPPHPPPPQQPDLQPPNEVRRVTPDTRQEPSRPASSAAPVLQHPQTAQGYTTRPSSATSQPPVTDGLQRPESVPQGRSPAPIHSNQPHTPSPVPAPALKWEPPYQPPYQMPYPHPHQYPHQQSHQQPLQASQHLPPAPPQQQHPPPHQTPVPSPRPPYNTGPSRLPTYPSQTPISHPQFPPNYPSGRQTPGQYAQQPRTPVQGPAPVSPSVLLPPQNAGQIPPSLQSLPVNATPDSAGQQATQRLPASMPPASSPGHTATPSSFAPHQAQHVPAQTPVQPPAILSATHPAVTSSKPPVPPAQWSPASVQAPAQTRPSHPPPSPIQATPAPPHNPPQQPTGSFSSSYDLPTQIANTIEHPHRPQMPVLQTPGPIPRSPRPRSASQVRTPVGSSPHIIRGHGTKWTSTPTPATPRVEDVSGYFDLPSPGFEPISPPSQPAPFPKTSPDHTGKKDMRKVIQKPDGVVSRPRGRPPRVPPKITPSAPLEEASTEGDLLGSKIKNEEATPKALEDIGDASVVDESVLNQTQPGVVQQSNKRKRQDSPPNRAPPSPATHVLWTRSFNKISQSALDQIISHRHANMFAHPVKPKTAPGYFEIVLRPQDLKGIQKAITAGSKAAAAAVATMADIEPSATNVWIPISVDLVPPRGIINIAQLERELVHMFANAIMYNPDPYRGFGPSFLRLNRRASLEDDGEDYRGYEVDENGVVKDTRSMFGEVEKLLSDLRNEVERNAPPPTGVPPSASRSMSVAGADANVVEDDADEAVGDASKRRRIRG